MINEEFNKLLKETLQPFIRSQTNQSNLSNIKNQILKVFKEAEEKGIISKDGYGDQISIGVERDPTNPSRIQIVPKNGYTLQVMANLLQGGRSLEDKENI